MYWVGFDVGGTFVDLLAIDTRTGAIHPLKHRSSRREAAAAVRDGLEALFREIGAAPESIERLVHGTTLVTNILIERAGAKVGMITTRGFRDVLEIGRMRRPHLYDLSRDKPAPLVDRSLRREVAERIDGAGQVLVPLDEADARAAIAALRAAGVEAVAVGLLHAYANPVHEERIGALLEEAGIPASLSARVSAEYGEYERFATTVLNSYVMPAVRAYLGGLAGHMRAIGVRTPLQIMQSNGGVIPAEVAATYPVRLASSGPAAGVMGAAILAARAGRQRLITLDMGGTSADVSLVVDGQPAYVSEHEIEGYPVRAVGIDVRSIGAGGGSLARLDRTGALRVGPESAGAEPGPACYGWGGSEPTVTDADLVLGYLNPDRFCRGAIKLDEGRARRALRDRIAGPRGVSEEEAALGILRVAVTNMVGAVRNISMQRGHDPRDFSLVAFGGAGPVHAGFVAAELNVPELLVLPDSGLLSAKGLLLTNFRADGFRTLIMALDEANCDRLNGLFEEIERAAMAELPAVPAARGQRKVTRILELCYEGQQQVIPIAVPELPLARHHLAPIADRLAAQFKATYGFVPRNRRPQILHLRVFVEIPVDLGRVGEPRKSARAGAGAPRPSGRRAVLFPGSAERIEVPVYDRADLPPDARLRGPAIVEEDFSTTVVAADQSFAADELGNLVVSLGEEKRHAA